MKPTRPMRRSSLLVVCFILTLALFSGCQGAQGNGDAVGDAVEVVQVSEPFDSRVLDEQFGGISVKEALSDGEQTYALYATFDDKQKAFSQLALATSDVNEFIQQEKGFAMLNEGTFEGYQNAFKEILYGGEGPSWFNESNSEVTIFLHFIDIYENEAQNQEIIRIAQAQGIESVMGMLPDYD